MRSDVMGNEVSDLATLFYLAIEAECDVCHKRFTEAEGESEHELWQWANNTAAAAYRSGWRDIADRPLCRECIAKNSHEAASVN